MKWRILLLRNFIVAAVIIGGAQFIKGHALAELIPYAAIWGALAAAIFTGTQYCKFRKGQACAICVEDEDKQID